MNHFEVEYGRIERRLAQLRASEDPRELRSTVLLYELERDYTAHQLQAWKDGRPFCVAPRVPPLISSLGFEYLRLHGEADKVTDPERYLEVLRAHGYPDHHCDRCMIGVALVLAGELPVPAMTLADNFACDPLMLMAYAIGQSYSPNYYCVDIDAVHDLPNERQLSYVTNQLREWMEMAESRVPGIRYDEDRLLELTEIDRQACVYLRDSYELRKRVPCPMPGRDVFRLPANPSQYPWPERMLRYYREMRDEIGERAERGIGAVKEEKARIMWTTGAPTFAEAFTILEEQGASVVQFMTGSSARLYGSDVKGYYGDESEYGRKLSPLEEQARMLTLCSWQGLANRWVDDIIYFCRELHVDGIVNFEQWGCVASVLARQVVRDRIENELGIPTIFVEGRNLDNTAFDREGFRARAEQFVATCVERRTQRGAPA